MTGDHETVVTDETVMRQNSSVVIGETVVTAVTCETVVTG